MGAVGLSAVSLSGCKSPSFGTERRGSVQLPQAGRRPTPASQHNPVLEVERAPSYPPEISPGSSHGSVDVSGVCFWGFQKSEDRFGVWAPDGTVGASPGVSRLPASIRPLKTVVSDMHRAGGAPGPCSPRLCR